ncbi:MAG: flagellin, partial [Hyphomicrobium sp.]|nr:flagellin [Hyphomicrobium sp.]
MNSIRSNFSAMTAMHSLQMTNRELLKTQGRISTGFRVANAEDNAAYWSIATTMRSDQKSLSTVKDALGLGLATVDVAYTAVSSSADVVSEIKSKLVAAREPGVDRQLVQKEVTELQNQLVSIASSATFSNQNWLSVDSSTANYNATR